MLETTEQVNPPAGHEDLARHGVRPGRSKVAGSDSADRIMALAQSVTSRNKLTSYVNMFQLYPKQVASKPIDDVVVNMVNGVPIRIRDVGRVEDSYQEQTELVRINGKPGLTLRVQKLAPTGEAITASTPTRYRSPRTSSSLRTASTR